MFSTQFLHKATSQSRGRTVCGNDELFGKKAAAKLNGRERLTTFVEELVTNGFQTQGKFLAAPARREWKH